MNNVEVSAERIIAIIQEENPQVLALAARRARIEMLEAQLAEIQGQPGPDSPPITPPLR